ncbi:hypothetical protein BDY19DRAFT_996987 [Irpex rosettiformis]|uniref:Uncharacterized protein n=1 Tax=Irpex rosettiformis TaxID=378272 RepID=A0ACB8TTE1_9APHY|nr:hypothetical protein BDY19DRAFT_996987 [Irpex rosettiformis]
MASSPADAAVDISKLHGYLIYNRVIAATIASLATRIAVITADLIVLLLTWRKAFGMIRHASRFKLQVPLLFRILVRDGTFFFLGLLAANVFKFVTTNISSLVTLEAGDTFLTPLTSMIISRFILNLQEINEKDDLSGTTLQSSIRFNSNGIVGSLGDRIMFGDDVDEGDQITTRGYDESRVDHL